VLFVDESLLHPPASRLSRTARDATLLRYSTLRLTTTAEGNTKYGIERFKREHIGELHDRELPHEKGFMLARLTAETKAAMDLLAFFPIAVASCQSHTARAIIPAVRIRYDMQTRTEESSTGLWCCRSVPHIRIGCNDAEDRHYAQSYRPPFYALPSPKCPNPSL
jgi:hypothetical protein